MLNMNPAFPVCHSITTHTQYPTYIHLLTAPFAIRQRLHSRKFQMPSLLPSHRGQGSLPFAETSLQICSIQYEDIYFYM